MPQNHSQGSGQELPAHPPAYGDTDIFDNAHHTPPIEQFEIDEDEVYEPPKAGSILNRMMFLSRNIAGSFQHRVVAPISHTLSPLNEAVSHLSSAYERSILKIGNPLVVKRLLYILMVVIMMYVATLNQNSDGVNGGSGGAFSTGKFYDVDKLSDTLGSYVSRKSMKENLEYFSSMPHLAGTTGDLALARYIESYFSNNGLDMVYFGELDTFLNFPKRSGTYLKLADDSFSATLYEQSDDAMQNLAYNPNSPSSSGEIKAPYIFANYGTPQDLQKLHDAGIEVKNTILLVKYGGNYPEPNKVSAAHRHGAQAVIFLTTASTLGGEEHDDLIGKMNVALTRYSPGDFLTPGAAQHSSQDSRLTWENSNLAAKIPCLPISWKDSKQLLSKLKTGADFGDGFFSGQPSEANQLKMKVSHEERTTHSIWNVVGAITGREQAEKGIIFGAPRDAVGYGASTTGSGTAALLELAKAFASLQRRFDWKPARSIYFVSFDATEYNLAGSAGWVEARKEQMEEDAYTYIELSDISVGDILDINANPLLSDLIRDELKKVTIQSKDKKQSLYDIFKSQHDGQDVIPHNLLADKNYLPFINSLNIPSMDIGFRGKNGVSIVPKNTIFDSFKTYDKALDSSMQNHVAIVELLARVGLRLAEEPMIPFNFNKLAESLRQYEADLERFVDDMFSTESVKPNMHYGPLQQGLEILRQGCISLENFRKDWKQFIEQSMSMEPVMLAATRRNMNMNMIAFNQIFLAEQKSSLRRGYNNYLFGAPFDAPLHPDPKSDWHSFPMVRDFIMDGDYSRAQEEIGRLQKLMDVARSVLTRM